MKYKDLTLGDYFAYENDPASAIYLYAFDSVFVIYSNNPTFIGMELNPLPPETEVSFITELPLIKTINPSYGINYNHQFPAVPTALKMGDQFFLQNSPTSPPHFITIVSSNYDGTYDAIVCEGPNVGEKRRLRSTDLTEINSIINYDKIIKLYE